MDVPPPPHPNTAHALHTCGANHYVEDHSFLHCLHRKDIDRRHHQHIETHPPTGAVILGACTPLTCPSPHSLLPVTCPSHCVVHTSAVCSSVHDITAPPTSHAPPEEEGEGPGRRGRGRGGGGGARKEGEGPGRREERGEGSGRGGDEGGAGHTYTLHFKHLYLLAEQNHIRNCTHLL